MLSSRGGRPPFEPTDEQRRNVEIMVGLGIPQDSICIMMRNKKDRPITEATLRKHFKKEIAQAPSQAPCYGRQLHGRDDIGREPPPGITPITDPKIRASFAELFARTRMGWQNTVRTEIANADGKPFVYVANKTDAKL